MKHTGETFTGQTVRMDGNSYERCRFLDCVLEIGGDDIFRATHCDFERCRWALTDHAAITISVITALYHGMGEGGRRLVDETFTAIRRGGLPPTDPPSRLDA